MVASHQKTLYVAFRENNNKYFVIHLDDLFFIVLDNDGSVVQRNKTYHPIFIGLIFQPTHKHFTEHEGSFVVSLV